MAVNFKVEHSRTSEYRLYPENITIKPELNGRHELPDIEWLIEDILRRGQVQPVTIRNDGGEAVLVTGFSRWRAISEINRRKLAPVKMMIRATYNQVSEQEGFLLNISENRFRNETTMIDDAHNINMLMSRYAMTEDQVVEVYFPLAKTPEQRKEGLKWIKHRLKLVTLGKEAEKAVRDGKMDESAAMAIAKLPEAQQKAVLKDVGDGPVTKKAVKERTAPAKAAAKSSSNGNGSKSGPKRVTLDFITKEINRVIDTGKFRGISKTVEASDDMIHWLSTLVGEEVAAA